MSDTHNEGTMNRWWRSEYTALTTSAVSARLRYARWLAGLSVEQAARVCSVPVDVIVREEGGSIVPSDAALAVRAYMYGCSAHWLRIGQCQAVYEVPGMERLPSAAREDLHALLAMCAGWK